MFGIFYKTILVECLFAVYVDRVYRIAVFQFVLLSNRESQTNESVVMGWLFLIFNDLIQDY